jgi:hypothetical protein
LPGCACQGFAFREAGGGGRVREQGYDQEIAGFIQAHGVFSSIWDFQAGLAARTGARVTRRGARKLLEKYGGGVKPRCLVTESELVFLRNMDHGKTSREAISEFNAVFNRGLSDEQFHYIRKKYKIAPFKRSALNKGLFAAPAGRRAIPAGVEKSGRGGFTLVKVSARGKHWALKHRLIWEAAYGKAPAGHKIVFADGDKSNFSLDNLVLVSWQEHLALCRGGLHTGGGDPALFRTALNTARLRIKISALKKRLPEP